MSVYQYQQIHPQIAGAVGTLRSERAGLFVGLILPCLVRKSLLRNIMGAVRKRKDKSRRRREELRPRNISMQWDILRCKPKIAANVLDFLVGEMLVNSMGKLIAN